MEHSLKNGQKEKDANLFQKRVGILQDLSAQVKKAFEEAMSTEQVKNQQGEKEKGKTPTKSRPIPASFFGSKPSLLVRQVPRKTATPSKKMLDLEIPSQTKGTKGSNMKPSEQKFNSKGKSVKNSKNEENGEFDIQSEEELEQEGNIKEDQESEEDEAEEIEREEESLEEKEKMKTSKHFQKKPLKVDSKQKYFKTNKILSSPEESEWVELESPLSQEFVHNLGSKTQEKNKKKTTDKRSKSTKLTRPTASTAVLPTKKSSFDPTKKQITTGVQNKTPNPLTKRHVTFKRQQGDSKKQQSRKTKQIQKEEEECTEEVEEDQKPENENETFEKDELEEKEEQEEEQEEEEQEEEENEEEQFNTDEEDEQTEKISANKKSRSTETLPTRKKSEKIPRFTIEHAIAGTLEESTSPSGIPRYRAEVWMDNGPETKKYKKKIFISVKNWTEKQIRARVLQDQKIREQQQKIRTKTSSSLQHKDKTQATSSSSGKRRTTLSQKSKFIHSSISL